MSSPKLLWDVGTAYDLFMSLEVLHSPRAFGLRGSWAAGVRQRTPPAEREVLEQASKIIGWPLNWVHSLSAPKDSVSALDALEQTPARDRLHTLTSMVHDYPDLMNIMHNVAAQGRWEPSDLEAAKASVANMDEAKHKHFLEKNLITGLEWWAHAGEYGERYLHALRVYYEVFFAEEERRIAPILDETLVRAQSLAQKLSVSDLMDELTQGLRLEEALKQPELVLVPSYWTTPLASFQLVQPGRLLLLFGARPNDVSLVPGDPVPELMLRTLKALSDPTRLRIMRYLIAEPMTPAQLARRLRLRAPTVLHHLDTLRLARLVHLTLSGDKEDRRYTARLEPVTTVFDSLKRFLEQSELEDEEADEANEE